MSVLFHALAALFVKQFGVPATSSGHFQLSFSIDFWLYLFIGGATVLGFTGRSRKRNSGGKYPKKR